MPLVPAASARSWGAGSFGIRLTKGKKHLSPRRLHVPIVDKADQLLDRDGASFDCFCENKALFEGVSVSVLDATDEL
jgi:hypothetical protein